MSLAFLFLVACAGTQGPDDSDGGDTDVTYGPNPIVPDAYRDLWDVDASSCTEGTRNAIVYRLFTGGTDGAGGFFGSESFYWFFDDEGWEGDCVDSFTTNGDLSDTNWQEEPCSGCDFEYTSVWNLKDADRTCDKFDYEYFFKNDRVDEDKFNTIVMLDPLSPSGNVNETTLIMMAFQDDDNQNNYSFDNAYGRGAMVPAVEGDFEGPTTLTWAGPEGMCIKLSWG